MEVATFVVASFAAAGAVATALVTWGLLRHAKRRTRWDTGELRRRIYDDVTGNQQLPHPDWMRGRLRHADLSKKEIDFVLSYRDRRDELRAAGKRGGDLRRTIKEAMKQQGLSSPFDANDLDDQLRSILLDSDG